ncbi:PAS domain S-box protein [Oryzomonas sagensis]|uniref:PAS domain S-box protein n=1 Tax=Oryzomonas sagensis TaxID=2603857 RepID=A0ABQ6TMB4_9BACT|nr:CheR family methyltransferase [Oryzomonas sagensis]KAB0669587.1 PAS domain S-box protein [Oryzomonas sagensis]
MSRKSATDTSLPACSAEPDEHLTAILDLVQSRTGHDFSSYKINTIRRRIERRMAMNNARGVADYLALLNANPREAHDLCREFLIGVTGFFRDPEAFAILGREVVPRLFAGRNADDPVRIWHPCCSTGEEAYSMAILIREYLESRNRTAEVLIFASDLDEEALAQARAGQYSEAIEASVGPERLATWFTRTNGGYQVVRRLREMVVFAHHSLIKDPPFSRLDLLVCRNGLIYLTSDMQKRLIPLFHQILKPEGFLFLGASETIGQYTDMFIPVHKKWKIFQRRESGRSGETVFPFSVPVPKPAGATRPSKSADAPGDVSAQRAEKILVERYAPPWVMVNEKYEVVHVSPHAGRFLEVPVGEPSRDILKMARKSLRPSLRAAIHTAFGEQRQVVFRGVRVADGDGESTVNVLVEPLVTASFGVPQAMVIFEPIRAPLTAPPAPGTEIAPGDDSSKDALLRQLEEQLCITHEQLQVTVEQLATSSEGFTSSSEELITINEEYQSMNEELQATNEELETSKEELQALNEELLAVNTELQQKVEELNLANSDMENLFASSGIAAIFLDRQLAIKRFSPAMAAIFSLIPADLGRPFQHLAGKLDWPALSRDALKVLGGHPIAEREVTTLKEGRCYLKRVLPYRNHEGAINGIVITFVDISGHKKAEETRARLAAIVESSDNAIISKGLDGRISTWNSSAERLFGYPAKEVIGKPISLLFPPELLAEEERILGRLKAGERIDHLETVRLAKDGRRIDVSLTASPVRDDSGSITGASQIVRDITERKKEEEQARHLASFPQLNPHPVLEADASGGIVFANPAAQRFLETVGLAGEDAVRFLPPDVDEILAEWDRSSESTLYREITIQERVFGETIQLIPRFNAVRMYAHEITKRKRAEEELLRAHDELEHRVAERTEELATALSSLRKETSERLHALEALRKKEQMLLQQSRLAAMGEMINNIAHQWRQPLNVLGLLVQQIRLFYGMDQFNQEFLDETVGKAMGLVNHMSQTIEDFRNFFKPDKEKVEFAIRDVVVKTLALVEESFKNQQVAVETQANANPMVSGYPNEYSQALLNILLNARDALLDKRPDDAKVVVTIGMEEGRSIVTITDNAGGIAGDTMGKIFEPYFTTKGPDKGTGVGLFMSKAIIEKNMNGRLTARNIADGAEFRIEV